MNTSVHLSERGAGLHGDEVEEDIGTRRDLGPVGRGGWLGSGAVVCRGGRVQIGHG